jgi:hypothetical protein
VARPFPGSRHGLCAAYSAGAAGKSGSGGSDRK